MKPKAFCKQKTTIWCDDLHSAHRDSGQECKWAFVAYHY
jgi:hypothetical protein